MLMDNPELKEAVSNEGVHTAASDLGFFRESHQVQNLNLPLHTYACAKPFAKRYAYVSAGKAPTPACALTNHTNSVSLADKYQVGREMQVQQVRVRLCKWVSSHLKTSEILHSQSAK